MAGNRKAGNIVNSTASRDRNNDKAISVNLLAHYVIKRAIRLLNGISTD